MGHGEQKVFVTGYFVHTLTLVCVSVCVSVNVCAPLGLLGRRVSLHTVNSGVHLHTANADDQRLCWRIKGHGTADDIVCDNRHYMRRVQLSTDPLELPLLRTTICQG